MEFKQIKAKAAEDIVLYKQLIKLKVSDQKLKKYKNLLSYARRVRKNPELYYAALPMDLVVGVNDFVLEAKIPKDKKKKKRLKKSSEVFGDREQSGLSILFKNAQGGKTAEGILFLESNKDCFCVYLTTNSTQLLEQTNSRIEKKLDTTCIRFDGQCNKSKQYNNDILLGDKLFNRTVMLYNVS